MRFVVNPPRRLRHQSPAQYLEIDTIFSKLFAVKLSGSKSINSKMQIELDRCFDRFGGRASTRVASFKALSIEITRDWVKSRLVWDGLHEMIHLSSVPLEFLFFIKLAGRRKPSPKHALRNIFGVTRKIFSNCFWEQLLIVRRSCSVFYSKQNLRTWYSASGTRSW